MRKKESNKTMNQGRAKKIVLGSVGLLVTMLLIAYLCISQYYKDHFYTNTYINGIDCSNLTAAEAKEKITQNVNTYVLNLKERNDVAEKISGAEIGLTCSFDRDINELLTSQSPYAWLSKMWSKKQEENPYKLSYNEEKLKSKISKLECLQKANIVEPKNATISEYCEEKGFTVVPEEMGTKVIKKKLTEAITTAVKGLDTEIDLEAADCYQNPTIKSEDEAIKTAMSSIEKYMKTKLTYTFGEKTEIFDDKKVGPAIKVDDEANVTLDENKVNEFVTELRKKYNTVFTTRKFMTSYGKEVTIGGKECGDYGWWLNCNKELAEILECIKNGEVKDKEPVYIQTAVQHGDDDIGNTYVEINLSAQHLFLYKDGQKVLESDFVSGKVSTNHETPAGVYPIQYTQKDATLSGANYNTPVKYWMPFNRDIGLHDASWKSVFGGDQFLYNGSHGCINLPPKVAEQIFGYVKRGTPVVCYHLSGTERYDKKKYNQAKTAGAAFKKAN